MHAVPNISATEREKRKRIYDHALITSIYDLNLKIQSHRGEKVKVFGMYSEAVAKICHFKSVVAGCARRITNCVADKNGRMESVE